MTSAALSPRVFAQTRAPEFDYIVIGAGSAGCVLANRLSADRDVRVLLVEAGPPPTNPAVPIPGRWTTLLGSELDWKYTTEPEPEVGGRRIAWPRGKTLGGSSTINALSYARGHRLSFDAWARTAGPAWAYQPLLPLFLKSERHWRGASDYHGADGPWVVAATTDPHDGHVAFLEAARELGFGGGPDWDFDGARQENAAGYYPKHIVSGRRHSVADAFLTPALARPNLIVMSSAQAAALIFTGTRASGVRLIRNGRSEEVRARREIVLAAGAIESPKLLMLSGVGPADQLRTHGIRAILDRPDVGAHLQDHPRIGVRWTAQRPFPGSSVTAGLFTYSAGSRETAALPPDLQFYVGRGSNDPDPFLTLTVAMTCPASRGAITLRSADPLAMPLIHAGYFTDGRDVEAMLEGIRLARALADGRALRGVRGGPVSPAAELRTPAQLRAFIRASSETMFHPAGTCRMGTDPASVVDPQLRVRGLDGLRVADASIMPTVVNAQINAACVMIGERAAELIRG